MFYLIAHIIKILFAWADLILFTAFMWLVAWLPKSVIKPFYPRLYQRWNWCFVRGLGVQLNVYQHNIKPLPKNYLLIANHPSAFEDVGLPAVFPVRALGKVETKKWWVVGRIAAAAGTVFVNRENKENRQKAAKIVEKRLAQGQSIVVLPEGGCFSRRLAPKFHYGTFAMAFNAGAPVIPVFIHYQAQEDFEWDKQTLLQKLWEIATAVNKNADYHIYDAFYPENYGSKEEMTEAVYAQYLKWQAKYLD